MKKSEQPRGLLYHIQDVPWTWFGTFTFGLRKRPDLKAPGRFLVSTSKPPIKAVRYSMFFQWLRKFEKTIKAKETIYLLRHELGEMGSRPHFHFLMVVPGTANSVTNRFKQMAAWEQLGGGFARIRAISNQNLATVFLDYTTKPASRREGFSSTGADKYESSKFEQSDFQDLKLSPALLRFLADR